MKDQRVLITGGTSGLGRALVDSFLEKGARVAAVARHPNSLPVSPGLAYIEADLTRPETIYAVSGAALSFLGGVDILINNASYLGETPLKLLLDTPCEDFERVLQTNVLGPFRLTKAILPAMILAKRGIVVNISSDAAVNAYPRWGSYSASKAALDHLTRIWATELSPLPIQFVAVDPGDMDTPMHAAAVPEADPQTLRAPREAARRLIERLAGIAFETKGRWSL